MASASASKTPATSPSGIGDHHRDPVVAALAKGRHQRDLGQERHAELVGQLAAAPGSEQLVARCRRRR